ncbi:oxidoreductase [Aquimarina sp. ERC-38]|uniref:WD40/YVTN/BNR-like repeat-containing protein n=1 Tax=Aquimarina sp. ERC-38 TaxID=2949996 RepID=UPI00224545B4|nr:oxidoreductase [Aquimarina sp. ERC-38]UZO80895.1 oxidoreductase [Aquimarina sp. ERC-38]
MKFLALLICSLFFSTLLQSQDKVSIPLKMTSILQDSIRIRALIVQEEGMYYAGTQGKYGFVPYQITDDIHIGAVEKFQMKNDTLEFRAIAANTSHLFLLSIGSPAYLFKIDKKSKKCKLVYTDQNPGAFYDSMQFYNDQEGIAMGDPTDSCISVITTRDGGNSWSKIPCNRLPKVVKGEAAFAASDTNIAIVGDNTWLLSGGKVTRVYYSKDKGKSWDVFSTPLKKGKPTTGGYSIDFYDATTGFIIGGDYTNPWNTKRNKAMTMDGGKTWSLTANKKLPNYKSCIQYTPNSKARVLTAVGFTGIDVSTDGGMNWHHLSDQSFYTLRFINKDYAVAAGRNVLSLLRFSSN